MGQGVQTVITMGIGSDPGTIKYFLTLGLDNQVRREITANLNTNPTPTKDLEVNPTPTKDLEVQ